MASEIIEISKVLDITEISSVAMSDIVSDGSGGFIRAFRFYGPQSSQGQSGPLVLEIRARSDDSGALKIATKPLSL